MLRKIGSDLIGQEVLFLVAIVFTMVMEMPFIMGIQHEGSGRKCTVKCISISNSIFPLLEL